MMCTCLQNQIKFGANLHYNVLASIIIIIGDKCYENDTVV